MNDQRSLKDQLTELTAMADRAGLYDAADYVRRRIEGLPPMYSFGTELRDALARAIDLAERGWCDAPDAFRVAQGVLGELAELRSVLDGARGVGPMYDHAHELLRAAASEHAELVAEGLPPLKPHEILHVFREAGCLYERSTDPEVWLKRFASSLLDRLAEHESPRVIADWRRHLEACSDRVEKP